MKSSCRASSVWLRRPRLVRASAWLTRSAACLPASRRAVFCTSLNAAATSCTSAAPVARSAGRWSSSPPRSCCAATASGRRLRATSSACAQVLQRRAIVQGTPGRRARPGDSCGAGATRSRRLSANWTASLAATAASACSSSAPRALHQALPPLVAAGLLRTGETLPGQVGEAHLVPRSIRIRRSSRSPRSRPSSWRSGPAGAVSCWKPAGSRWPGGSGGRGGRILNRALA